MRGEVIGRPPAADRVHDGAFGDGPRRVGDAWLERLGDKVALAFVIGTALVVKRAP